MATLQTTGSKGHHTFTLQVTETGYSEVENKSTLSFSLTGESTSYNIDWNSRTIDYTVTINGTNYTVSTGKYPKYQSWTIISKDNIDIPHDLNGAKSIYIGFSVTDNINQSYSTGNASASGTMVLTTLDCTAPAVQAWAEEIGVDSFKLLAGANAACDVFQYSFDNANWHSFYSGETISGLNVNTEYTVYVRMKKLSNQIWGQTAFTVKTTGGIVYIKTGGVWKEALPYIKAGGAWKRAIAYKKLNGAWKIGI